MTIEAALVARLAADGAVAGLVGARIYWARLPQAATLPAIRLQRVVTTRPSAMGADGGFMESRFQVDVWADDTTQALALRRAVRAALQRWRDAAADPAVQDTFIEDERDHGLDPDLRQERAAVDIVVWHEE